MKQHNIAVLNAAFDQGGIMRKFVLPLAAIVFSLVAQPSFAGDRATAPEAEALVTKASAFLKANGPEKAFAEFNNKGGQFTDRDLYIVAYDSTGKCLAHGANPKLTGKDLSDAQDVDGVYYIKDRMEMMKSGKPFWQDYKFTNPVDKKVEPKRMYCIPDGGIAVCGGVYK
jgi:cytochrome c